MKKFLNLMTRATFATILFMLFASTSGNAQSISTGGYSITASPVSAVSAGIVTIAWTAPSTHSPQDWVGLFLLNQPSAGNTIVTYKYVPVGSSGLLSFNVPNVEFPHTYQFRYLLNNGFAQTATSNAIVVSRGGTLAPPPSPTTTTVAPPLSPATTVVVPPTSTTGTSSSTQSVPTPAPAQVSYSVRTSPAAIPPGGTAEVSWQAPGTHSAKDWVGLFLVDKPTAGNTIVSWRYVPSGTSGTLTFTTPTIIPSQLYEFRYLLDDSFSVAAKSNPVTISSAITPPTTSPQVAPVSTSNTTASSPPSSSTGGTCPNGEPLAFEGAEGFGRCAQGGRGGRVIDVSNLNNTGPGSLRQCAEVETGPRSCVLRVPGTISLNSYDIIVRHDYLTIDGSNAPVALKDGGISVRASHVIIRHLRVRPGPASLLQRGVQANGIFLFSRENGSGTTDIIVDHCSISWGTDDLVGVLFGTDRVTIQDSILSEALRCDGCGSRGLLIAFNARQVSVIRTLNAHNFIRFPEASSGSIDFVNNVDYNGNGSSTQINPVYAPVKINMIGNYWKDGPSSVPFNLGYNVIRTIGGLAFSSQSGIYVHDNVGRSRPTGTSPETNIIWGDNGGIPVQPSRYLYPQVTTTSALQAYEDVLSRSGAQPRDSVDTRVVADVRNGTGAIITSPMQVGGWPLLSGGTP